MKSSLYTVQHTKIVFQVQLLHSNPLSVLHSLPPSLTMVSCNMYIGRLSFLFFHPPHFSEYLDLQNNI